MGTNICIGGQKLHSDNYMESTAEKVKSNKGASEIDDMIVLNM